MMHLPIIVSCALWLLGANALGAYPKPCAELRESVKALGSIEEIKRGETKASWPESIWGEGVEIKTDHVAPFFYAAARNIPFDDWTCSADGSLIAFAETEEFGYAAVVFRVYRRESGAFRKVGAYRFIAKRLFLQEEETQLTREGLLVVAAASRAGEKEQGAKVTRFFPFSALSATKGMVQGIPQEDLPENTFHQSPLRRHLLEEGEFLQKKYAEHTLECGPCFTHVFNPSHTVVIFIGQLDSTRFSCYRFWMYRKMDDAEAQAVYALGNIHNRWEYVGVWDLETTPENWNFSNISFVGKTAVISIPRAEGDAVLILDAHQ